MEQLQSSVSYVVLESAIESAVLWVMVLVILQWSNASSPRIREILFLLPLFLPVALVTTFHILLPMRPSAIPHFHAPEALIGGRLALSLSAATLFLLAGMAGVAASLALIWGQRRALSRAYNTWRQQQGDDSRLRYQCNITLRALASRAGLPVPRLVLHAGTGVGSLALGRCGYVFMPRAIAEQLDDEELEGLLAHELAHIARRDGITDCLAKVCRNLMLFNPLAHLALSKFEREREQATDDLAIKIGGNRLALASCLLKGYRFGGCHARDHVTGLLVGKTTLERRVLRMIHATESHPPTIVSWITMVTLVTIAVATFAVVL